MPNLARISSGFPDYLEALRALLISDLEIAPRRKRRVMAALGLAVSFWAWRSLSKEQGLGDKKAAAVMTEIIEALIRETPARR